MGAGVVERRQRERAAEESDRTFDIDEPMPVRPGPLTVGRAADPAEDQADRFAEGLLRDLSERPMNVQRSTAGVVRDELGGTSVDATTSSRIQRATGGRALPDTIRRAAESRSGRDLSGVRVHTGAEAADLSDQLQATAFTVGRDVFLGADADRPGTGGGDALLGHELGHVVQQGGGVASRSIQRQSKLIPLHSSGAPTVQRLFGKKKSAKSKQPTKSPLEQVNDTVEQSKEASTATIGELATQISTLESALGKLLAQHTRGNTASQSAAYGLKSAAERILGNLPDQGSKSSKLLGRLYPAQVKRLQRIIDETQLILDEHLVEMSKREAGNIYHQAGQDAGTDKAGGLQHLVSQHAFKPLGERPTALGPNDKVGQYSTPERTLATKQSNYDQLKTKRDTAASLGLSPAELAAIVTFSGQDYKYINPATANNREWLNASNSASDNFEKPDISGAEKIEMHLALQQRGISLDARQAERKKELDSMTGEGAMHTAMAVQGLLKLPPWTGHLYRGETLTQADFDKRFGPLKKKDRFKPREKSFRRSTITSATKDIVVAVGYAAGGTHLTGPGVPVVWDMEVTNGRDIEPFSSWTSEREVALLPGAEFDVLSAEYGMKNRIFVKCKQRR